MEAGKITHFGSFEEVRDAGAAFALASNAAGDAPHRQVAGNESATAATLEDEEEDEELQWTNEQASRTGAYAFYIQCTGVVRTCGMFALITTWGGIGIFAMAYLSSRCFSILSGGVSSTILYSACNRLGPPRSLDRRIWGHCRHHVCVLACCPPSTDSLGSLVFMAITLFYFGYTLSTFTAPHIHNVRRAPPISLNWC